MGKRKYRVSPSYAIWLDNATAAEKIAVANEANTTTNTLCQILNGHTRISPQKSIMVHKAMKKITPTIAVPLWDFRPDIWKEGSEAP